VLQQISANILASSSPGLLSSTSSAGAVKIAHWRKKQKNNPRPKIPESHLDIMEEQIPDKLTMANHQRLKLLAEQFGVLPDKEYLQQEAHELQKSYN